MEMELRKGEIQVYCTDVLDASLALIHSALSIRSLSFLINNVEFIAYNQEQHNTLNIIIDDIMSNFTNYYYATGDNYLEHPYYLTTLVEGEELKDYHKNYFENNPIFKVEYEKISNTTTKILFSIKDKDKCIQALDEYCFSYGCDEVYNDEANTLTREAQDKQLYNLLTENDYNLSNFVVNDLKYIKALCYNEYKDKLTISNAFLNFDYEGNKLAFKCTIADEGFVEEFRKSSIAEAVNTEIQKQIEVKPANRKLTKLTDTEKHIISARAYLEAISPERVSYKKIAQFLTDNGINKIKENNVKQRVIGIYNKLDVQDLASAVMILREANCLISYDYLDK